MGEATPRAAPPGAVGDVRGRAAPTYRASFVEERAIVERGEQVVLWFARFRDGWLPVKQYPKACVEAELDEADSVRGAGDALPPGVVWRREVELAAPRGTVFRRHVSRPRPLELQALDYLRRGMLTMPRHSRQTYYRLTGNYALEPIEGEQPPAARSR